MIKIFKKINKWFKADKVRQPTKATQEEIKSRIESVYPLGFYDKMLKIKPTVVTLLSDKFATRDDDILLLFAFWELENGGKFNSYEEFKSLLMSGNLAIPDTITRTRRELQADNKELRGNLYEVRKKAEKLVTSQMRLSFD